MDAASLLDFVTTSRTVPAPPIGLSSLAYILISLRNVLRQDKLIYLPRHGHIIHDLKLFVSRICVTVTMHRITSHPEEPAFLVDSSYPYLPGTCIALVAG